MEKEDNDGRPDFVFDDCTTPFVRVKIPQNELQLEEIIEESAVLQKFSGPAFTQQLNLPLVNPKGIVFIQEQAVKMAIERFTQFEGPEGPNQRRGGCLIGDGPGVGKGRICASIIYDAITKGLRKHVYFSQSSVLKAALERDFVGIGAKGINIFKADNKITADELKHNEGVLFVTYKSVVSEPGQKEKSIVASAQFDRIKLFMGGNFERFEGVIVFDESHTGKNAMHEEQDKVSRVGKMMMLLQEKCPRARVVYSTATVGSVPRHLAYLDRLGLWGEGKFHKDFNSFNKAMKKRELSAMEVVCIELKRKGALISRQLSWQNVEFLVETVDLGAKYLTMYNDCNQFWRELHQDILTLHETYADELKGQNKKQIVIASFFICHLNFNKSVIVSAKTDTIVRLVQEALDNGESVIIGIQTTGEAALRNQERIHECMISSARAIASSFVENYVRIKLPLGKVQITEAGAHFREVGQEEEGVEEENDDETEEPLRKRKKMHRTCLKDYPDVVDVKEKYLKWAKELNLPGNFLDVLLDRLKNLNGKTPARVAELTGRRNYQEAFIDPKTTKKMYKIEDRIKKTGSISELNEQETELFMSGQKNVAVISDASSTGISLHAEKGRVPVSRKRVHITAELMWSSENQRQQLGRSHRSNQVVPPKYVFVVTDLPAEKRFTSTIAKRFKAMGALSNGDRRTCIEEIEQFDIDNPTGQLAIESTLRVITGNKPLDEKIGLTAHRFHCDQLKLQLEDLSLKLNFAKQAKYILPKVWNRLIGCSVEAQRDFLDLFEAYYKLHEAEGGPRNSIKFLDDKVPLLVLKRQSLRKTPEVENHPHGLIELLDICLTAGQVYDEVYTYFENDPPNCAFFREKEICDNSDSEKKYILNRRVAMLQNENLSRKQWDLCVRGTLQISDFTEEQSFSIVASLHTPHIDTQRLTATKLIEFLKHYQFELSSAIIETEWEKQYEYMGDVCIHKFRFGKCDLRGCKKDMNVAIKRIITGDLLAIWDEICTTLNQSDFDLYIGKTEDEKVFYGIHIPQGFEDGLKYALSLPREPEVE